MADQVLALANRERSRGDVGPLVRDSSLAAGALAWSAEMQRTGFRHADLSTWGSGSRAENIAMGQADAQAVMTAWMNSTTGHREAILNPVYTRVGIGVHTGPDGRLWWTMRLEG